MSPWIYNGIGGIGVIMCLVVFLLLQMGRLKPEHWSYSTANFVGALCILFSLIFAWNLSSFLIELSWAIISAYGLLRLWRKRSVT